MGRRHAFIALVLLVFGGLVQAGVPEFNRGSAKDRRELRREATRWLRARQRVLRPCEGCGGKGVKYVPRVVTGKGLTSVPKPHKRCHASGVCVSRMSLKDLYRPYIEDAQDIVGLGDQILTEADIEEILDDPEADPKVTRKTLMKALGIVRRSAQVKKMTFEQRTDGALVARVTTTVAPYETRWIKIDKRWHIVGSNDFQKALELAVPQEDIQ